MYKSLTFLLAMCVSLSCYANWSLNNDSSKLTIVTTKAKDISEIGIFKQLAGAIDDNGKATLKIDLSSIDTNVPIRNQRMVQYLFEVNDYPTADLTVQFDPKTLSNLQPGDKLAETIQGELSLHGLKAPITADLNIVKLDDNSLFVSNQQPILVNAKTFNLVTGIEKLDSLVNHPGISNTVPVDFNLVFSPVSS